MSDTKEKEETGTHTKEKDADTIVKEEQKDYESRRSAFEKTKPTEAAQREWDRLNPNHDPVPGASWVAHPDHRYIRTDDGLKPTEIWQNREDPEKLSIEAPPEEEAGEWIKHHVSATDVSSTAVPLVLHPEAEDGETGSGKKSKRTKAEEDEDEETRLKSVHKDKEHEGSFSECKICQKKLDKIEETK